MPRLFLLFILLAGCSGLEKSEYAKIRKQNAHAEQIYRKENQYFFPIGEPKHRTREDYAWEEGDRLHPKITKEFFRCKGSSLNPAHTSEDGKIYKDCDGKERHSLPLKEGKEFVYPILLDILNYIQKKTHKKVVVTCGHRCPLHNEYADSSSLNRTSKHMIGAEVDFYVQGMEERPMDVIDLIFAYYREKNKGDQKDTSFYRYQKEDTNVSTPPWYNKEIFIKLYLEHEGRDYDNRHPYPYIGMQVRYDPRKRERVTYTWEKAHKDYTK